MQEIVTETKEGFELDIQKLLIAYLRRWWLIVLCVAIGAGSMFWYSTETYVPEYRTGVTIYVNSVRNVQENADAVSGTNIAISKMLVSTYVSILKSNTVMESVIQEAGLSITADELKNMITASQLGETEIFQIYVTHTDPQMAAFIANAVADAAPESIANIVQGSSTRVIDYAQVPTAPIDNNILRNTFKGGVVGAVLAVGALTLLCLLDVRIKSEEDLELLSELPVLGQIPDFSGLKDGKGYGYASRGKHKKPYVHPYAAGAAAQEQAEDGAGKE